MWLAVGFYVLAGISNALNTLALIRRDPARPLPLFRRNTSGWGWRPWTTYLVTQLFALVALYQAAPHTGFLVALTMEAVIILGPPVVIATAHNHHLSDTA